MKYLLYPFRLIFRVWFYVFSLFTLVLLVPVFFISTYKESWYPKFWKVLRIWSYILIYGSGFGIRFSKEEEIEEGKSYMFCANHASLMDVSKLVITSKNPIVFVGKKELRKLPIFGYFYKKVAILVDRSSKDSRKEVYQQAKNKIKNGYSIAIFPEGKVPTEDVILSPFKNGAFSLAIEHQLAIVPQVYYDGKRLMSWDIWKGGPGIFRIKQLKFIQTKDFTMDDVEFVKLKTFNLIENELVNDKAYMLDTAEVRRRMGK